MSAPGRAPDCRAEDRRRDRVDQRDATDDNQTLGDDIHQVGAGKVVHLKIFRDGKTIDVDATLSTKGA